MFSKMMLATCVQKKRIEPLYCNFTLVPNSSATGDQTRDHKNEKDVQISTHHATFLEPQQGIRKKSRRKC